MPKRNLRARAPAGRVLLAISPTFRETDAADRELTGR